jgi:hypothetical protein
VLEVFTTVEQGLLVERMEPVVHMELELVLALAAAAARAALGQVRSAPPVALVAGAAALEL